MPEYIEREALNAAIHESWRSNPHNNQIARQTHNHEHRHFLGLLYKQPAADVVEVVRCKDCKYFIPDKCLDHTKYPNYLEADGLCGNIDKYTDEDRFCSSGAKMDGKGEGE